MGTSQQMQERARAAGLDYHLLVTDRPLDAALSEYLFPSPGREMMGFFAPWFLRGPAAVGLPVYIHLLRRQTTTPRPVSSLMFFERGIQSSTRHRRLRYLLLFTLRALLILLLALAFARSVSAAVVGGPRANASCWLQSTIRSACAQGRVSRTRSKRCIGRVGHAETFTASAQVMALGGATSRC